MCAEYDVIIKIIKNFEMKTQINSMNNWSVKGIITVTILSAMLCAFGAKAGNKPSVALKAVNVELKSENRGESGINSFTESNNESVEKYNAAEFVQAEMALEIESRMNSNEEINNITIEAEQYHAEKFTNADITLEIDNWMNDNDEIDNKAIEEYNAAEFVQAEMTYEIKSWMNNSCL